MRMVWKGAPSGSVDLTLLGILCRFAGANQHPEQWMLQIDLAAEWEEENFWPGSQEALITSCDDPHEQIARGERGRDSEKEESSFTR